VSPLQKGLQTQRTQSTRRLYTLPFAAVDIEKSKIIQSPEIGARTKNHKAAVTFLLPIDSLMKPVREWHEYISKHGGRDLLWRPAFK